MWQFRPKRTPPAQCDHEWEKISPMVPAKYLKLAGFPKNASEGGYIIDQVFTQERKLASDQVCLKCGTTKRNFTCLVFARIKMDFIRRYGMADDPDWWKQP